MNIPDPLLADNVENNIESVATTTGDAATELSSAAEYQRKAGRRAACLMLILVFVVAIVLFAVRPAYTVSTLGLIHFLGLDVMDERERSFPPACVSLWNQQYRISHLYNRMLTTVHLCVAFSDNIPSVHENPAPG